jgi:hypothetical protein
MVQLPYVLKKITTCNFAPLMSKYTLSFLLRIYSSVNFYIVNFWVDN